MGDNQDIIIELTDVEGQSHRLRLLAIFEAGNDGHRYGAFITEDIMLYRYDEALSQSDGKKFVSEIPADVYPSVSRAWSKICQGDSLDPDAMPDEVVYMVDENQGDIAISGTVLSIFPDNGISYIAICPHAVIFYRYNEFEKDGQDYVEWSDIELAKEYEEVSDCFNDLMKSGSD